MICSNCNTANDDNAKFCNNCGAELTMFPAQLIQPKDKSLIHLLIIMSWEYSNWIIWYVVQRWVIPAMEGGESSYGGASSMYAIVGWVLDVLSILLILVIMIISKNKTLRTFLAIFLFIRVVFLIIYRIVHLY